MSDPPKIIGEDTFLIDEHDLVEEWQRQPSLYHHHAQELADARHALAEAKLAHEVREAELDALIRSDPSEYGVAKITEGVVERTLRLQDSWQESRRAVHEAEHVVDLLQAAVRALDHRKSALENFVSLWLHDYYASPKVRSPDDQERLKDRQTAEVRRKGQVRVRGEEQ